MLIQLIAQETNIGRITGTGNFNPINSMGAGTGQYQLEKIFTMIVGFLTIAAGLAFLVYFLIGAISWLTAGGDTKKVDDAKHYMTNGAIGMIIIVAAYSIIWIVGTVLGVDILNPAIEIENIQTPQADGNYLPPGNNESRH
jgi:hypothetical protein